MIGRLRHPQTTVRWRLTLLYGVLFLVSGAVLLTVTYVLVDHAPAVGTPRGLFIKRTKPPAAGFPSPSQTPAQTRGSQHVRLSALPPAVSQTLRSHAGRIAIQIVVAKQRIADLHQLIIESAIALGVMTLLSGALGWLVAGRVLRPLRTMTAATEEISAVNLHERLAMEGPRDELRRLADTIDGLLSRLEGAFDAQRRFVANASHELRTPLTAARALLEMVLTDPSATVGTFRTICRQVLEESEQQEQLIDSLLALAHGERGIDRRESVDLSMVVADVVGAHGVIAAERDVQLDASLHPAMVAGDPRLVERLVGNVVENALLYNVPGGRVRVEVTDHGGRAELRVANTGPVVAPGEVQRLLAPFQRLGADRVGHGEGFGLGLSIVAAIATAHDAELDVQPGVGGGLDIRVRFPATAVGLGLGEGRAGEERAQRPGVPAHAQGAVGDEL